MFATGSVTEQWTEVLLAVEACATQHIPRSSGRPKPPNPLSKWPAFLAKIHYLAHSGVDMISASALDSVMPEGVVLPLIGDTIASPDFPAHAARAAQTMRREHGKARRKLHKESIEHLDNTCSKTPRAGLNYALQRLRPSLQLDCCQGLPGYLYPTVLADPASIKEGLRDQMEALFASQQETAAQRAALPAD
jgi:hypothetical protein